MPDNSRLVALIRNMKRDTLMGDVHAMHRAILSSQFLVPLHESPTQTAQGTRMLYMTFDDAVSGPQSMRKFARRNSPSRARYRECLQTGNSKPGAGFW